MSETKELRFTSVTVEARAEADKRTIGGYAAKFNKLSQNLGGFVERIATGFFNQSRADGWPDVFARDNHDDVLASAAAGTLRLSIDETGLTYEADLEADVVSQRVWLQVNAGNYRGSSFAFSATEEDWGVTDQGFPLRTLVAGRLYDVSPVVVPAYRDTSAQARSIDSAIMSLAQKFEAEVDEIRSLAEKNELIKLFKRSDVQEVETPKSISSQEAIARALARTK